MALVGAIIVVLGFIVLVKLFGLVEKSTDVIEIARSAASIVRNAEIDDLQKEIAMQKYAKELFYLFFVITIISVLAIAIPFGLIWLLEFAGVLTVAEVIDETLSLKFIAITIVLSIALFWVGAGKQ
jgi:hypothetical protein